MNHQYLLTPRVKSFHVFCYKSNSAELKYIQLNITYNN